LFGISEPSTYKYITSPFVPEPETEVLCSITGLVVIAIELVVFVPMETLADAELCSLQVAVALAVIGPPEKLNPVFFPSAF